MISSAIMFITLTASYLLIGNQKHVQACKVLEVSQFMYGRVHVNYVVIVEVLEFNKKYAINTNELGYYEAKLAMENKGIMHFYIRGYDVEKLAGSNTLQILEYLIIIPIITFIIGLILYFKYD